MPRVFLLCVLALALAATGCGKSSAPSIQVPVIGAKGDQTKKVTAVWDLRANKSA